MESPAPPSWVKFVGEPYASLGLAARAGELMSRRRTETTAERPDTESSLSGQGTAPPALARLTVSDVCGKYGYEIRLRSAFLPRDWKRVKANMVTDSIRPTRSRSTASATPRDPPAPPPSPSTAGKTACSSR